MTNLDSVLKSRNIILPTKVHIVKAMVFPVVMYGCESWTVKKAECRRIDAFELWCWRTPLRVPWTARRSNQSILKKINPEYSLEGLMLKLELQYFGHLMWRADSLEKTLMLGKLKTEGKGDARGWDGWMASPTQWIWVWVSSGRWWRTGKPGMLQSMGSQKVRHDWATEQATIYCYACTHAKSPQSCLSFCNPVDCSPPSSSVHVIFQARLLEWVAMPFSRGSSQPRDQTLVSYPPSLAGVLYH